MFLSKIEVKNLSDFNIGEFLKHVVKENRGGNKAMLIEK